MAENLEGAAILPDMLAARGGQPEAVAAR